MPNVVDFSTHYFYDRVINVRLIKTTPRNKNVVTFTNPKTQKNVVKEGGYQYNSNIYRFEGYSHKEYSSYAFGNLATTVVAKGPTYKYDLDHYTDNECFSKGKTPQGALLQDGDRLLVKDGGRWLKYHIVEVGEERSEYYEDTWIDIKCPEQGLKPAITFSVNMLPGQNIYGLTVRITNLNLDIPIREFNKIRIEAGYRTESTQQSFDCDIFSSYMEQPNPDGVGVFVCLVVGKTNVFMSNYPIRVHYLGGKCTVGDVVRLVCDSLHLKCHNYLLSTYNNLTFDISASPDVNGVTFQASNASALLDWLRKILTQTIKLYEQSTDSDPQPAVILTNDGLFVYCINRANADIDKDGKLLQGEYTISDLDAVKGATFNGVALTVKTVWHPELTPGRIFRMSPNIINGANLPNVLTQDKYRGSKSTYDYYRVLTMSVNFSTTGTENEMTVTAVPLVYVQALEQELDADRAIEDMVALVKTNPENKTFKDLYLGVAEEQKKASQSVNSKEKAAANNMFGVNVSGLMSGGAIVKAGERYYCVSITAQQWLVHGRKTPDGQNSYLGEPITPLNNTIADRTQYTGVPVNGAYLWPIIAVATYAQWKLSKNKDAGSNKWASFKNLMSPDTLEVGELLYIPDIPSMQELAKYKDIFKFAVLAYSHIPTYADYIGQWKKIYLYLGGNASELGTS